ncbi:hypothetical protein HU200_000210 [Digitaria exilis]|uniref:Uncharacterized protein n=1 Tax=Digitaria exilis TaxID=1010633 RepID=A0A835G0W3_9POAL|nr:hypothetical protein HU200_000210 [Digitaria exilis]
MAGPGPSAQAEPRNSVTVVAVVVGQTTVPDASDCSCQISTEETREPGIDGPLPQSGLTRMLLPQCFFTPSRQAEPCGATVTHARHASPAAILTDKTPELFPRLTMEEPFALRQATPADRWVDPFPSKARVRPASHAPARRGARLQPSESRGECCVYACAAAGCSSSGGEATQNELGDAACIRHDVDVARRVTLCYRTRDAPITACLPSSVPACPPRFAAGQGQPNSTPHCPSRLTTTTASPRSFVHPVQSAKHHGIPSPVGYQLSITRVIHPRFTSLQFISFHGFYKSRTRDTPPTHQEHPHTQTHSRRRLPTPAGLRILPAAATHSRRLHPRAHPPREEQVGATMMADGDGGPAAALPPCRLGGAGAAAAPGRQCCGGGGCGLGLARLVRRLRRRGRRALRGAAAAASSQQRRRACQYDPLSYARNFDLGGGGDDAARVYHGCSFSSRFVLVPAVSATATSSASSAGAGAIDASAGGAAPAAPGLFWAGNLFHAHPMGKFGPSFRAGLGPGPHPGLPTRGQPAHRRAYNIYGSSCRCDTTPTKSNAIVYSLAAVAPSSSAAASAPSSPTGANAPPWSSDAVQVTMADRRWTSDAVASREKEENRADRILAARLGPGAASAICR